MKYVSFYIDLAFCVVLLPLLLFVFPVERWWGTCPVFFTLLVGWHYVTYFVYRHFVLPRLFRGGRQRMYAVAVVVLSLAGTFLFASYEVTSPFYHLRQQLMAVPAYPLWGVRPNQQAVWLHYIIVVTFCFAVGMLQEAYRQRLAREEMEYERNKAELALYKSQIHPHFLFNTLNTLYGLLITRSDQTQQAMEGFITLMRYMYQNARREYVPLSEEVTYISQYIGLQRLRLDERTEVSFVHQVENGALLLPPMLLITFVENAFKYGVSADGPCSIRIRLCQQADRLQFSVENPVSGQEAVGHRQQTGIDNCRRRLSLLYPGRHRLEAGTGTDGIFRVRLVLPLSTPAAV